MLAIHPPPGSLPLLGHACHKRHNRSEQPHTGPGGPAPPPRPLKPAGPRPRRGAGREKMAAAAGWVVLGLALWLCAAAGEPEGKRRAGPAKKKDIRDYNDADMARLLEQWEVRGGVAEGLRFPEPAEGIPVWGEEEPRSRLGAARAAAPRGTSARGTWGFGPRGPAVLPGPGAAGGSDRRGLAALGRMVPGSCGLRLQNRGERAQKGRPGELPYGPRLPAAPFPPPEPQTRCRCTPVAWFDFSACWFGVLRDLCFATEGWIAGEILISHKQSRFFFLVWWFFFLSTPHCKNFQF